LIKGQGHSNLENALTYSLQSWQGGWSCLVDNPIDIDIKVKGTITTQSLTIQVKGQGYSDL